MTPHSSPTVPPTPKQVNYARLIAARLNEAIPWESAQDRRALSDWISAHRETRSPANRPTSRPVGATSRQVGYAEKIARRKRLNVPEECFRDAGLMSAWISHNR
ncbi:MAG: hypothetical protein ACC631_05130 [Halocynthiibacter sp.]